MTAVHATAIVRNILLCSLSGHHLSLSLYYVALLRWPSALPEEHEELVLEVCTADIADVVRKHHLNTTEGKQKVRLRRLDCLALENSRPPVTMVRQSRTTFFAQCDVECHCPEPPRCQQRLINTLRLPYSASELSLALP